jgi:riboflavin-specific deaminase-like protein
VEEPVYGPLVAAGRTSRLVIGQFGQSLDGRIATPSGESKYLNGPGGLQHLHRLRALVDAVVVGVSTVAADNPMLTVRMVEGPNPARVVIDPHGRVAGDAHMFATDGVRRVVVTSTRTERRFGDGIEVVRVAEVDGRLAPRGIVEALAAVGLQQILIEGGAETVSRFLQAGELDRLHVSVAPVLVGGVHRIGEDVLFDCAFRRR